MQQQRLRRTLRSSALIIVLLFVSLITILAVGFLSGTRVDTISTRSHAGGVRADIYADAGVATALSQLYLATSPTTYGNWISQPGRIFGLPIAGGDPVDYELNSGTNSGNALVPSTDQVADLNPQTLQSTNYLIAQTNPTTLSVSSLDVQWIYQLQDGSFTTNAPTSYIAGKTPMGRFAYWVDDEGTKINLNTAWDRNASNATNQASPSRISLDVLTGNADLIHAYGSGTPFNSVEEVRRATNDAGIVANEFSATAYSHSPDLDMFGEPRILLTTQKSVADANGTTNFLDILTTANTDPGPIGNLNATKTVNVLNTLCNEMGRTDWPFAPGKELAYSEGGAGAKSGDIQQLALNILDYVRSVESTSASVDALRVACYNPTNFAGATVINTTDPSNPATNGSRFSSGRKPYFIEMGVEVDPTPIHATSIPAGSKLALVPPNNYVWYYTGTYYARIYYPNSSAPSSALDLTQFYLGAQDDAPVTPSNMWWGNDTPANIQDSEVIQGSSQLRPGTSALIQRTGCKFYYLVAGPKTAAAPSPPTDMQLSLYLADHNNVPAGYRVEISAAPTLAIPSPYVGTTNYVAVDDPLVNKNIGDWVAETTGTTGTGLANGTGVAHAYGKGSTAIPPQDVDVTGNVTTNFMVMPGPRGYSGNPSGLVQSVAELGLVHTGTDYATAVGNPAPGTPWRTLHLQPQATSTYLPDWAVTDLFSAPLSTNTIPVANIPFFLPSSTNAASTVVPSRGGRINVNSTLYPFSTASSPGATRILPLAALLNGATNAATATPLSSSQAMALATNILSHTLAANGQSYGNTNIYYTPAQLAEIKGIADQGEGSESVLREITSLAAVNSNVFSIYTVGQAVVQDKSGKIHVLGERRKQVIVERTVSSGIGSAVQFRPVISRTLEP